MPTDDGTGMFSRIDALLSKQEECICRLAAENQFLKHEYQDLRTTFMAKQVSFAQDGEEHHCSPPYSSTGSGGVKYHSDSTGCGSKEKEARQKSKNSSGSLFKGMMPRQLTTGSHTSEKASAPAFTEGSLELRKKKEINPFDAAYMDWGFLFLFGQLVCGIVFIVEITIRLISYGGSFFGFGYDWVSKEWRWNMFDLLCLVATIVDLFYDAFYTQNGNTFIAICRQFRIIRAARVIRAARFARELRKMIYALQYSGSTLLWAIVTLSCVMYFFATAFTHATTYHLRDHVDDDLDTKSRELQDAFGTLPRAFHSLFQAVSGGVDWEKLVNPLMKLNWTLPALFLLYISLTMFGVMNVVTSVFVESAAASYQHYKDLLIQENLCNMQVYIDHLKEIFVRVDSDSSGEISMDELEMFLTDPSLQQYLESIDVHPDDAKTLFKLLDKDGSGKIDIDEFCGGCLRLKGEAKSFDIHCIIYENERIMHKFQEFIKYLDRVFLNKIDKIVDSRIQMCRDDVSRLSMSFAPSVCLSHAPSDFGLLSVPSTPVAAGNFIAEASMADAALGTLPPPAKPWGNLESHEFGLPAN